MPKIKFLIPSVARIDNNSRRCTNWYTYDSTVTFNLCAWAVGSHGLGRSSRTLRQRRENHLAVKKFGSQLATPIAAGLGKKFGTTSAHGNMNDDGLKLRRSWLIRIQTSRTSEPFDLDGQSATVLPAEAAECVETGVNWFSAFWRFTRPHTIIGSVSSCLAPNVANNPPVTLQNLAMN